PVQWGPESRFRPFCCARCKLIDLGQWATEQYRVPDETRNDVDPNERSGV
ncbi:MAG: DNA gyrase inhibitor YacG, partial [Burkholderiales bacterium]